MEYVSNPSVCRACMGCVENIEVNNSHIEMFSFCTAIKIVKNDTNTRICFCNNCTSQLVKSYNFIKQCLKSDIEWQSTNISEFSSVKMEEGIQDDMSGNFSGSNTIDSDHENDSMIDIKTDNVLSDNEQYCERVIKKKVFKKVKVRKKFKNENVNERKLKKHSHYCPVCEIGLPQAQLLQLHLKHDHPDFKKYFCHICDKGFRDKRSMRQHFVKHSDQKNFKCDKCHKVYKFKGALRNHVESHLFGMHKCDKCDKSFEHSQSLKSHMTLHKGHKPHLCDTCGQGFALATNLKVHMRIHSGERPYKCSLCSYSSSFYGAFRRHKMSHTKSNRKPCTICGKDFSDLGSLKRHSRLHTGELPYKCDYCEMGFVDGWKRRIHIVKHHNIALADIPHLTQNRNATKVILDSDEDGNKFIAL